MRVVRLEIPHLGNRTHLLHDDTVAVVVDPPRDLSVVESAARVAGVEFDRVGVHDHETLAFGAFDLRVIATPGYTPHHVAFLAFATCGRRLRRRRCSPCA